MIQGIYNSLSTSVKVQQQPQKPFVEGKITTMSASTLSQPKADTVSFGAVKNESLLHMQIATASGIELIDMIQTLLPDPNAPQKIGDSLRGKGPKAAGAERMLTQMSQDLKNAQKSHHFFPRGLQQIDQHLKSFNFPPGLEQKIQDALKPLHQNFDDTKTTQQKISSMLKDNVYAPEALKQGIVGAVSRFVETQNPDTNGIFHAVANAMLQAGVPKEEAVPVLKLVDALYAERAIKISTLNALNDLNMPADAKKVLMEDVKKLPAQYIFPGDMLDQQVEITRKVATAMKDNARELCLKRPEVQRLGEIIDKMNQIDDVQKSSMQAAIAELQARQKSKWEEFMKD